MGVDDRDHPFAPGLHPGRLHGEEVEGECGDTVPCGMAGGIAPERKRGSQPESGEEIQLKREESSLRSRGG